MNITDGFGPEALRIEFDLVTGFIDVPSEECSKGFTVVGRQ
jgi:hypothetical protein